MKKGNIIKNIFSIIVIVIGCGLAAFSIGSILIPNLILDGGINGVSIMLSQLVNIYYSFKHSIFDIRF